MKQFDLAVNVPDDAIQVPMVVVVYVKGKVESGLIVRGEQQVTIRDAEVHASVKLLQDPGSFDPETLLHFAEVSTRALRMMAKNVSRMVAANQIKTVQ